MEAEDREVAEVSDERTTADDKPIFPRTTIFAATEDGMTAVTFPLRDWLAGQALAGILASGGLAPEDASSMAYEVADAMIAERDKP